MEWKVCKISKMKKITCEVNQSINKSFASFSFCNFSSFEGLPFFCLFGVDSAEVAVFVRSEADVIFSETSYIC